MRRKPGQHLSQDGVSLAQHVGQDLNPFDLVVASELPRAIETAIAMGFAVDRLDVDLGVLPKEVLTAIAQPADLLGKLRSALWVRPAYQPQSPKRRPNRQSR